MDDKAAEVAHEQEYFDNAAKHRERRVRESGGLADAAANAAAAKHLKGYADALRAAHDGSTAVAVGRVDNESGETLYIGRQMIRGDGGDLLVVSWQVPAAEPFHLATYAEPRGLTRKRTFDCENNTIRDFADVRFGEVGPDVDPYLLAELARGRDGAMRDIVATIQAAQYELISAPLDRVLVIEGGPGTGKTAIGLHRVSWLLARFPAQLTGADVLIVGPNAAFSRYIGKVLPGLGDADVVIRDVGQLAPAVTRGLTEPADVARLKGDERMAGLLARALEGRIGTPEPAERLMLGGRFVTLPGAEVAEALIASRTAAVPYAQRRELFGARVAQLIADRLGTSPAPTAVENLVERLWPRQAPQRFLWELFGSRARLRAAGSDLSADEISLLHRRGEDRVSHQLWTDADLPLLDEADALINGAPDRYRHVVVDEAQDLSPMQLRAVARRSAGGSLTLLGDLAQSTGAWARDSWDEVTRHLPATHPVALTHLRYGYRVPKQVYELGARLLTVAAPAVTPPDVVRDGPAPEVHPVDLPARAGRVAAIAAQRAADGDFVGIVCPPRCRRETEAALAANGVAFSSAERGELGAARINLVSPREAKGLEFDAVVVIEPEQIVADDERGHRMLYVALTRTTKHLDIVCVGDPLPLSVAPSGTGQTVDPTAFTDKDAQRLAEHLAARIRAGAPAGRWADVLARAEALLHDGVSLPPGE